MSEELEARIREILNNGTVRYNPHLKTRMAERNYEMGDVLYILRNDKVLKFKKQGNDKYHCEIHGEDLEGYRGAVVAIVIKAVRLDIVTVLGGV